MRIFIASGIFHPEPGGPATYLYNLLPELIARGHEVRALTYGDDPVADYPYPLTRVSRQGGYLRRQRAYQQAAARIWPGCDLAYVHTLGLPLPDDARPRIAKIVGDKAWERAVNRGWVPPDFDIDRFQRGRLPPLAAVNRRLRAQQAQQFDHIIVPSMYLKKMVIGWDVPPDRVTVIYNALRSDDAPPGLSQQEARRHFGLPSGPLLVTAARLTPWKGVDHTLDALARVGGVRLVVAGDGPARRSLTARADELRLSDRARFLGRVSRADMPVLFRAADYTLLYSGYEGLPHVLLESLAAGTPVIASYKGGNPEVIRHGENGLLVPYVDVDALTNMIHRAFAPGVRAELAAHTADGLVRFDWDRMVKQTVNLLERYGGY
jgi:glycosyltransferase involved in cell wall biosynthesis